jgi:hypothetical protein
VGAPEGIATLDDGDAGTVPVGETVVNGALGAHAGTVRRSATRERTRTTAFSLRQLEIDPPLLHRGPGPGSGRGKERRSRR